ncbi:MAG: glycosyltransferase family 9 protein, partial [Desulfobacterales bacterium]|nr:glycosyltransferase family 9 protein [Desulfobacterales bacterium]
VAAFPALLSIKAAYGPITMICQNHIGSLSRQLDIADKWYPLEAAAFASLHSNHVYPAVKKILPSFVKILLFSRSSSFEKTLRSITKSEIYRIRPRPGSDKKIHVSRHILSQLARYKLIEKPGKDVFNLLSSNDADRRDPDYLPSRIFIHPGSGSRKKCWPIFNFIKIAALLEAKDWQPEFIFGPAEYDLFDRVLQRKPLKAKVHKLDTLTRLALLLKTGGGFIGNDSGVSHLSAFLGLPTVAVFGPSDPEVWKPKGRAVEILQSDKACGPCFGTKTCGCEEADCFSGILPEDVLAAFFRLVHQSCIYSV